MRGLGTDVVDLDRFRAVLARTPRMADRLFTDAERARAAGRRDPVPTLAARFAAKEAVMKVLGAGLGDVAFHEIEVGAEPSGRPTVGLTGRAAALAAGAGITTWHLSLSHSDLVAVAVAAAD
ncbi:MAG TPA: holo-ACP synthase [Acidimicrobiales bacterium]|nr:holo-ACP synthase [Acidimicrobiales bacterium]